MILQRIKKLGLTVLFLCTNLYVIKPASIPIYTSPAPSLNAHSWLQEFASTAKEEAEFAKDLIRSIQEVGSENISDWYDMYQGGFGISSKNANLLQIPDKYIMHPDYQLCANCIRKAQKEVAIYTLATSQATFDFVNKVISKEHINEHVWKQIISFVAQMPKAILLQSLILLEEDDKSGNEQPNDIDHNNLFQLINRAHETTMGLTTKAFNVAISNRINSILKKTKKDFPIDEFQKLHEEFKTTYKYIIDDNPAFTIMINQAEFFVKLGQTIQTHLGSAFPQNYLSDDNNLIKRLAGRIGKTLNLDNTLSMISTINNKVLKMQEPDPSCKPPKARRLERKLLERYLDSHHNTSPESITNIVDEYIQSLGEKKAKQPNRNFIQKSQKATKHKHSPHKKLEKSINHSSKKPVVKPQNNRIKMSRNSLENRQQQRKNMLSSQQKELEEEKKNEQNAIVDRSPSLDNYAIPPAKIAQNIENIVLPHNPTRHSSHNIKLDITPKDTNCSIDKKKLSPKYMVTPSSTNDVKYNLNGEKCYNAIMGKYKPQRARNLHSLIKDLKVHIGDSPNTLMNFLPVIHKKLGTQAWLKIHSVKENRKDVPVVKFKSFLPHNGSDELSKSICKNRIKPRFEDAGYVDNNQKPIPYPDLVAKIANITAICVSRI